MKKKGYSLFSVIIIIVLTSIVSGVTVGTILTKNSHFDINGTCSSNDPKLNEFLELYTKLNEDYYDGIDSDKLIDAAINGMLAETGETYTSLLDEKSTNDLLENLNGIYEGVGITIVDHSVLNIVVGSPAEKAGILPGDEIKSINNEDVSNLNSVEISNLIKNCKEKVTLVITRDNKDYTFNLNIETLNIPAVSYQMLEGTTIGYMKVSVFSNNVSTEIKKSLQTLKKSNMNSLIIDLRGNNGGYLVQAYKSASLFTKKGSLIYSLKSKKKTVKYKDTDNNEENIPIIVLINNGTASAAEILASALKDSYNATLVGSISYGKGKVQHTYSLSSGRMAKYTSSLWLRPNGTCIDEKGITPDVLVENEFVYDNVSENEVFVVGIIDNQFEKAKELLSN